MALSGTITKNVGSYWRLRLYWTATQDEANNRSTITSRLYWETTSSSYGAIYSSSSKSGYNKIHTSQSNFTATAGLSNGQVKLLDTHSYTVTHNSSGDASAGVYGSFSPEVTLSGTYYGTVSLSGTASLDRIARASTLSVTPSWTAGSNDTISVSRASSSFKHEASIYALDSAGNYGGAIKTVDFSTSQTSLSTSFTEAENRALFVKLNGRTSTGTRIILKTYSGSTFIGQTQRDGTLTAPSASHPTTGYDAYQYVDEEIDFPITRAHSNFLHTVRFKLGSYTKTITGVGTSVSWNPTAAEQASLYGQMPNDSFRDGTIEVDTFYEGVQVRDTVSKLFQFHVRNSNPTFLGAPTYADINTTTTAITGNNQSIIQGKSKVKVTLLAANRAEAINGAKMRTYSATLAGKTVNADWSSSDTVTFDFNEINASTNQTLVINAIDSRGKSASVTKTVSVIPYTPPTITASAARVNGFEASTLIQLSAKFSPLAIGSPAVAKNYKMLAQYRIKESKATTWGSYVNFTTAGFPNMTATNVVLQLDNLKSYSVEFKVSDRLGESFILKTVSTGQPLFFLDDMLSSIGFGDFPKFENEIMINKRVRFGSNMYAGNANAGESVGGALEMANSDITGINGLYFNDVSGNSGEGLLFPHDSTPVGSMNSADYDNFYMRNKQLYINNGYFLQMLPDAGAGNGMIVGAGGLTIVGAGESQHNFWAATPMTAGQEYLHLTSDENVYIHSNMQAGYAARKEFRFDQNGYFYRPRYKETNGFNTASIYSSTSHEDLMLIQSRSFTINAAVLEFVDVSFPTAFASAPEWIIVQMKEGNSAYFSSSPYNITTTGCRVYTSRSNGGTSSVNIQGQVIACGRKP